MIIAILMTTTVFAVMAALPANVSAGTAHATINISDDSQFTAPNGVTSGTGSEADPYIISGWDIDASSDIGIEIRNTNVYFIVQDCYVSGATWNIGFYLQDNLHATVRGCNLTGNYFNLYSYRSNTQVLNCTFDGGQYSLYSERDYSMDARGNSFTNAGNYAIYIWRSLAANCVQNQIDACYEGIYYSGIAGQAAAILGNSISDCTWTGIYATHSRDVKILGNNITNSVSGIELDECEGCTVFHNNIDSSGGDDYEGRANQWDNGYPSGGNHWVPMSHVDAFSGPDQDIPGADGIDDTPVPLWNSGIDRYPLYTWFSGNVEPAAGFNLSKRVLNTTTPLYMNASISADLEDLTSALLFRWDYEGDMIWDTGLSSIMDASHTYALEGNYTVRLEVQDTGGLTGIATRDIIVSNKAHDPIFISWDTDFMNPNSTTGVTWGSGTEADPYIISDWVIDASETSGIYIQVTTAFFIIRDCQIYFGGLEFSGIFLYNVENGKVESSTSMMNDYGIISNYGEDVEVTGCLMASNLEGGIYFSDSNNTRIDGNNASFNEIGIYLLMTDNSVISNNVINNCTGSGALINTCFNVTALRNNMSGNQQNGISAQWSERINIVRNEMVDDPTGAYVVNSDDVSIVGNNFTGISYGGGIYLQSVNRLVAHHNNLINLASYANDPGVSTWDLGYPLGGNHWDIWTAPDAFSGPNQDVPGADGIVDSPYYIDVNSIDNYPLTAPFDMSNLPPFAAIATSSRIVDTSSALDVDALGSWDVEDPASALEVRWDWESDGTFDTGWSTTKTASHTYAVEGIYTITLEVRDTAALVSSSTIEIVVDNLYQPTNIHIIGDGQFDVAHGVNGGGDGSSGNPYIIQDYVLDATDSRGIWIETTDAFFTIQNVKIYYGDSNDFEGIWLNNVQNGSITLSSFFDNEYGIGFQNSGNLSISDCSFESCYYSVYGWQSDYLDVARLTSANSTDNSLYFGNGCDFVMVDDCDIGMTTSYGISIGGPSHDIQVTNNRLNSVSNGMFFQTVSRLAVTGNNATMTGFVGFYLYDSDNCTVSGNEIYGSSYGMYIYDTEYSSIDHNFINATNSYAIYIQTNSRYLMIDNCRMNGHNNGIRINSGSEYIMVSNCTAENLSSGVRAYQSSNISVRLNDFSGASSYGVYTSEVSWFEIIRNNLSYASYGVYLFQSANMNVAENIMYSNAVDGLRMDACIGGSVEHNTVVGATTYGIRLAGSINFLVAGNNLIGNSNQAYDDSGSQNRWNATAVDGGGNYWSNYTFPDSNMDGFGDTPAIIDGDSIDYLPLASPWVANLAPTADFTASPASGTLATSFSFDASGCSDVEDATALLEVRWDWTNDGTYDTGWSTTKTIAHSYPNPGTKTIGLQVRDTGGLTDTVTKTVTVSEVAPVTVLVINGTAGSNDWYTSDVLLNLTATDDYSGVNWTRFSIGGAAWVNYSANITMSTDGTYTFEYRSEDLAGYNETIQSVTVKIDTTAPTLTFNQSSGMTVTKDYAVISWNGSDATSGIDHFEVSIDGGSFVSVGTAMSYNFTALANGAHNVTVKAVDKAGHEYSTSIQFTVSASTGGEISGDVMTYILIILVIVVVVVALLMVMRRGKKPVPKLDEMKPEPPAPPAD